MAGHDDISNLGFPLRILGALSVLACAPHLWIGCTSGQGAPAPGVADATAGDGGVVAPPLVLAITGPQRVRQGSTQRVPVALERNGRPGVVTVEVLDLPEGVVADPLALQDGVGAGAVTLRANATAPQGGPYASRVRVTVGGASTEQALRLYVAGAPGTLDTSFDFDGQAVLALSGSSDILYSTLPLADGKTLLMGTTYVGGERTKAFVARVFPDGTLDAAFGNGGKVLGLPVGSENAVYSAVPLRAGGYLMSALMASPLQAVGGFVRLSDRGAFDTAFGESGFAMTSTAPLSLFFPLPSGGYVGQTISNVGVYKFDANGAMDPTFGADGRLGGGGSTFVVDRQGKLVVVERAGGAGQTATLGFRRHDAGGALDPTFNAPAGQTLVPLPGGDTASSPSCLALPDGKIVATASSVRLGTSRTTRGYMLRLLPTGGLDPTFGSGGLLSYPGAGNQAFLGAPLGLPDGSVLVQAVDFGGNDTPMQQAIRVQPDGSLDRSFGNTGVASLNHTVLAWSYDAEAGRAVGFATASAGSGGLVVQRLWL